MPYAKNNMISMSPIEGGIYIDQNEYTYALDKMQEGYLISIDGGFKVYLPEVITEEVVEEPEVPQEPEVPVVEPEIERITVLTFIERFTYEEQLGIVTATMTIPEIKLWYDKLIASEEVVLTDYRLLYGMEALVEYDLITPERKQEILEEAE